MSDRAHMTHEEYIALQRERAQLTASAIIAGEIGVVEGVRKLLHFQLDLDEAGREEIMRVFILVEDDTDHLPAGPETELWNREAVESKRRELQQYEDFYRADVVAACQRLIDTLKNYPKPE